MKTVIEIDKKLKEGEILVYKDGKLRGVDIHELLPELRDIKSDIKGLQEFQKDADTKIKELRGEDDEED